MHEFIDEYRDDLKRYMWKCGVTGSISDAQIKDFIENDEHCSRIAEESGVKL